VFFDQMPRSFDRTAVAGALVVQYEIGGDAGGAYFVEVDAERCVPREGTHAAPTLRVAIDAGDWLRLNAGELDGAHAFLSGRLRVDGDLEAAMRLGQIFRIPATSVGA
jgi:putative sterol carrier protein